jgi:hypothetical protein
MIVIYLIGGIAAAVKLALTFPWLWWAYILTICVIGIDHESR